MTDLDKAFIELRRRIRDLDLPRVIGESARELKVPNYSVDLMVISCALTLEAVFERMDAVQGDFG